MSIIRRAGRAHRYTIVANDVIEDNELSFRALGLLVYLLSKPDDWTVDAEKLADTHAEGRDAVRAALDHLELAGYAVRRRYRAGGRYATETVIYDRPHDREISPIAHRDGKPALVNRDGFPGPYVSTDSKNGKQAKNAGSSRPRRITESDDPTSDAGDAPAPGQQPRKTTAERNSAADAKGTSAHALARRLRTQLEDEDFLAPVNVTAVAGQIRAWNLDPAVVRQMIDLFTANPRHYLKGDEVPWVGFLRQRQAIKKDATKMADAADPAAKFRAG